MMQKHAVQTARFNPDGSRIVTASGNRHTGEGEVQMWDAVTARPLGDPLRHGDCVWSAQFSPDGATILTACKDGIARVWKTPADE
jgi:WD40 repeat protein